MRVVTGRLRVLAGWREVYFDFLVATKIQGNHQLQGNVPVCNVRIPVLVVPLVLAKSHYLFP